MRICQRLGHRSECIAQSVTDAYNSTVCFVPTRCILIRSRRTQSRSGCSLNRSPVSFTLSHVVGARSALNALRILPRRTPVPMNRSDTSKQDKLALAHRNQSIIYSLVGVRIACSPAFRRCCMHVVVMAEIASILELVSARFRSCRLGRALVQGHIHVFDPVLVSPPTEVGTARLKRTDVVKPLGWCLPFLDSLNQVAPQTVIDISRLPSLYTVSKYNHFSNIIFHKHSARIGLHSSLSTTCGRSSHIIPASKE